MSEPATTANNEAAKIKDVSAANAAWLERQAAMAEARYAYHVDRRDRTQERLRYGVFTLNAGSMLAIIAATGGDGAAVTWLGFNPQRLLVTAGLFTGGAVAAGLSIWAHHLRTIKDPSDALGASAAYTDALTFMEMPARAENQQRFMDKLAALKTAPVADFSYSIVAIILQGIAGALWLVAIALPLFHAVTR